MDLDDIVMVDHEQSPQGEIVSGPDDLAFVEAPPREHRSKRLNAPPKKSEGGGLMGLFGSLRKHAARPELPERRKSYSHRDEMTEAEREERRARREDRRRRSMRPETDGEGFTTDAGPVGGASTEAEDEARRAERKARIAAQRAAAELREAEERRARREKAREVREKRAREEEEREERRREEKRARRTAREERRAREEQAAREAEARAEAKAAEQRERRRMSEAEQMNGVSRHGSKSGRRHQYHPEKRSDEDYYGAERRYHRSHRSGDERPRTSRRKSTGPDPAEAPRYPKGGKDKTSSWVDSQMTNPPEAPPIVPTVLDVPAGHEAAHSHSLSSDEETRRRMRRQARRRAKHPGVPDEEIDEIRSRRRADRRTERDGMKSSSGSGDYERDRSSRAREARDGPYASRPASSKRTSWFKKLTTL
jgi:hypothetical protein